MTTSDMNWGANFPTAISCLMNEDTDDSAHYIITSRLQTFEEKFLVWLEEIPHEIEKKFSGNITTKLSLLPKTPSVKNRARIRLNDIQEKENNSDPSPIEMRLKPEKTNSRVSQVAVIVESPKGRPKRSCRNTATISSTASARKVGLRTSKTQVQAPPPKLEFSNQDKEVEFNVLEPDSKLKSSESVEGCTVSKTKAVSSQVGLKEGSDNQSPSVRDRARAYETMLNYKTKSPTKSARPQTPNSANRNFASATISSLAKSSPQPVVCLGKRISSSASSPCKMSTKAAARLSKRSSRRSSRLSKSRSEHPGNPPKPTRSKLTLKKKSADVRQPMESDMENVPSPAVVAKKGKNRSSMDSAVSSASSMMSPKSSSCDDDQHAMEGISEGEKDFVDMDEREEDVDEGLDVTHTVITEVYDLSADGKEDLIDYEKVETKTIPASIQEADSDTQVSEEVNSKDSSTEAMDDDGPQTFTKDSPVVTSPVARTTRTRARALQVDAPVETGVKSSPSRHSTSVCYTELKQSSSIEDVTDPQHGDEEEEEQQPRSTRTRTRVKNQQEGENLEESGGRRTRTRQRQADASKDVTETSVRDVSVVSNAQTAPLPASSPELGGAKRSTRSRMRQQAGTESISCGVYDDEVVAGSPAMKTANTIRCSKKRPVEEYGASPKPKRSRSCAGRTGPDSTFNTQSILLTSSPRQAHDDHEDEDTVDSSLMSPARKQPRPFTFTSAQKSSFHKRTPAFARTNSKVYSFMGSSTPAQSNGGALSSFLKRNTPKSKTSTLQVLQEQKIQKLQEKENKERERLKRAAETKKQKLEEQKRLRDDRLRKVAEARERKFREELEQKERINKKFEDQATLKDRMLEEKLRAEYEKKELRDKKMNEANFRRRQEEEERQKKREEMEEDARRQQDWLQRKKEYEEEERKRNLQKVQEEKARQKKLEEEKREQLRKERERQLLAMEKAEKERIEREKREERERKLEQQKQQEELRRAEEIRKLQEIRRAQEQEKIRMMEAAQKRIKEETMRMEKEREAKKIELQKLTDQIKNGAARNTSTSSKEPVSSYMITPVKAKVYKPSTDPNNYDICDKGSDESTDEEDAPKKKIPEWAMGVFLNAALIKQYKNPPDIKDIFRPHLVEAPDLTKLFPTSRQRHKFKYRTSSAIWTSPAMKK